MTDNWTEGSVAVVVMLVCSVSPNDGLVNLVLVGGWLNVVPLFDDWLKGVMLLGG